MMTRKMSILAILLAVFMPFVPAIAEEPVPELETPVLMIGDSMMRLLGKAMVKEFKKADIQPADDFSSLGSGLVRPSIFNWNTKVADLCDKYRPKTVFVALGTNDRQTLEKMAGGLAEYGSAEWKDEYRKLVEALVVQLKTHKVDYVVWMMLPPMKGDANNEHAQLVNAIVTELSTSDKLKGFLLVYDMERGISSRAKKGKFTQTIMSPSGSAIKVRDQDGVHLTYPGGQRIAQDVIKTYWKNRK